MWSGCRWHRAQRPKELMRSTFVTKSLRPPCREIRIFSPDPLIASEIKLIASDCLIHLPVYCNHFLFACQAVNTISCLIFGYFRVFENPWKWVKFDTFWCWACSNHGTSQGRIFWKIKWQWTSKWQQECSCEIPEIRDLFRCQKVWSSTKNHTKGWPWH